MTNVFIRRNVNTDRDTQREECHMKMETEISAMLPPVKECQKLLATTRS